MSSLMQLIIGVSSGALLLGIFLLIQAKKPKRSGLTLTDNYKPLTITKENVGEVKEHPQKLSNTYPAIAFTAEGIKFPKIPKRTGNVSYVEPSMPTHGARYLVVETSEGNYELYDPREAPLLSDETPQKAYRAIMWDVVKRVYAYHSGVWDKVNTILIGCIIAGAFLVAIVAIDKIGK